MPPEDSTDAAEAPATSLIYVRQRWLDASTGQWLSTDPVEGEPAYTYVRNSPTTEVDPGGTQTSRQPPAPRPGPTPHPQIIPKSYAVSDFSFKEIGLTYTSGVFAGSKFWMVTVDRDANKKLAFEIIKENSFVGAQGIIEQRNDALVVMDAGYFDENAGIVTPSVM